MLGKTADGIQFVVMIAVIDSPYCGRLDSAPAYRRDGMIRIDNSSYIATRRLKAALVNRRIDIILIEARHPLSHLLFLLNKRPNYHARLYRRDQTCRV